MSSFDFNYSTDFYAVNAEELSSTCIHLICKGGEGSFVFNERCFHIKKNDLVVTPMPDRISNLAGDKNLEVEWFAADYKFLQNLLPSNNYSIGGSISLNSDPVIPLNDLQAERILDDFNRLESRMNDKDLMFYRELMGSLCLTLMYDIFEPHAQRDASSFQSNRTSFIIKQFINLLSTGISSTEREVKYYADRLNVSSKYLSSTVKRVTGHNVSSYISRYTVPIIKNHLEDDRLSLTQISEMMNFNSPSYFSRYCTKHLGQSPSEYRQSIQPKGENIT